MIDFDLYDNSKEKMTEIHETTTGEETGTTITEIRIAEAAQEVMKIAIETDLMIEITLIAEIDMMNVINMTGTFASNFFSLVR